MSERAIRASFAGVAYQVNVTDGQHQWASDVDAAAGGGDVGPSPHGLLLSSLGACTSITVAMYAQRKEMPLQAIDVDIRIEQEQLGREPRIQIARDIRLSGPLSEEQRTRLLEVANACPIHKVLSGEIIIASKLVG
ncbi:MULTISPECIES: OsmC family protein [Pseudomonas]|uniref:OsmC family protein n=1 Tax=Pseudomonas TaxID=286 RepID=UPI0003D9356E|nr:MULTISPECIES: OsmC family protein [Pseudomonas]AHD15069.1 peroxiredoxin [Pseudomonas sp. FGI182]